MERQSIMGDKQVNSIKGLHIENWTVHSAMAQNIRFALLSLSFCSFLILSQGFNLNKLRQGSSSHRISNPREAINNGEMRQEDRFGNILLGFGDTSYPRVWGGTDSRRVGGDEFGSFGDLQDDFLARGDFLMVNINLVNSRIFCPQVSLITQEETIINL